MSYPGTESKLTNCASSPSFLAFDSQGPIAKLVPFSAIDSTKLGGSNNGQSLVSEASRFTVICDCHLRNEDGGISDHGTVEPVSEFFS